MVVTDTITDGVDVNDGSNQGVDTLSNIQQLEFVNADGTVTTTFQVDDYSNAADPGNYQIQYGVWVNGRANYYGDTDWYKLTTVAGEKVEAVAAEMAETAAAVREVAKEAQVAEAEATSAEPDRSRC